MALNSIYYNWVHFGKSQRRHHQGYLLHSYPVGTYFCTETSYNKINVQFCNKDVAHLIFISTCGFSNAYVPFKTLFPQIYNLLMGLIEKAVKNKAFRVAIFLAFQRLGGFFGFFLSFFFQALSEAHPLSEQLQTCLVQVHLVIKTELPISGDYQVRILLTMERHSVFLVGLFTSIN